MRTLKKINNRKNVERIKYEFYVFDVETTALEPRPENFVFGVIYGWNFKKVIYSVQEFINEFKDVRYHKKTIFAHNAEFDLSTLFENIYQNMDNSAIFNGRFISAEFGNVKFGDSFNILPTSVAKIGEALGLEKLDNQKISGTLLRKENITDEDIMYCTRDCEIIYEALLMFFEDINAVKLTISSIALYDFRNNYLAGNLYFSELVDHFYDSYYGGRTEAFHIGKVDAETYDINSLYPYVMSYMRFPDVKTLKKVNEPNIKFVYFALKRYEGMCKVKIRHKEHMFGFIPYRTSKLLFPVGEFETIINFNELRFAVDHGVVEILSCEYMIYSNPVESPFRIFIEDNYTKRKEENSTFKKLLYKLKMNSLYGRFAMRKKMMQTYYDLIPFEIIEELEKTNIFYELKMFNQHRNDCFMITENKDFKNSFHAVPTFSSYITSEARIVLLKSLLENKGSGVVYCDTDSIMLSGDFIGTIGNELGEFKNENKNICEIRGLKNYSYQDESGMIHDVIKGVSLRSVKIDRNTYQKISYYKTKESLRRNVDTGSKKILIKKLTHKYDKRVVKTDGSTNPIKF